MRKALFALFLALAVSALLPSLAVADENGVPGASGYNCDGDAISGIQFVCDGLKLIGVDVCTVTANSCVNASQEIFSGLNIEFANPQNIKNWTGFGGTGEVYADAALCLMSELANSNMTSRADVPLGIGELSTQQRVGLYSFDPKTLRLEGWHRARACAPILGCFDGFTQKFILQNVVSNFKGSPERVGEYQIFSSHALQLTAQGQTQSLSVDIPSIAIKTPYGEVEAIPKYTYGKLVGWVTAPYAGGNVKSAWQAPVSPSSPGGQEFALVPHMIDLYGRVPGKLRSQMFPGPAPAHLVPVNIRGLPPQFRDPFRGWISQISLGSRTVPEKQPVWSAPSGFEYPARPDFALHKPITPRSDIEKFPNIGMGASVKVDYSPTDLLPEFITNSPFITIDFHIFVTPSVGGAFGSQLQFVNMEASKWSPKPGAPATPKYAPDAFRVAREFHARAGSSAAAQFKMVAGVDLTLTIKIPLVFTTIKKTLIDIHPRYTFVDATNSASDISKQKVHAASYSHDVLPTGKPFQRYQRLNGSQADGFAHIQACLAGPKIIGKAPPPPSIEPGDPNDFADIVEYPCNICIGSHDNEVVLKENNKTVKTPSWVKFIFQAQVNNRPIHLRTRCDNTPHIGCMDRCKWNKTTNVMTVLETAQEMYLAGRSDMPRCNAKLSPLPIQFFKVPLQP